MKATVLALALGLAALAGCATQANSSEAAWQRAQCDQIIDAKAREKCMDRVNREFGKP